MDWEAEGLLEGLEDEEAHAARRELLDQLHDEAGRASRSCARRSRRTGSCCSRSSASWPVTRATASARSPGVRARARAALGSARRSASRSPTPTRGSRPRWTSRRPDAAALAEAGFPFEDTLEVTRVLGAAWCATRRRCACCSRRPSSSRATRVRARRAASARPRAGDAALRPHARRRLPPAHAPAAAQRLHRPRRAHRRQGLRHRRTRSRSPTSSASRELGERVASRSSAASPAGSRRWPQRRRAPVRVVKQLGDAVMLVSPDARPPSATGLALIERAEAEQDFPPLHAGVAAARRQSRGRLLRRAGQPGEPPVRRGAAGQRAGHRGTAQGRRREDYRFSVSPGWREATQGARRAVRTFRPGRAALRTDRHAARRGRAGA